MPFVAGSQVFLPYKWLYKYSSKYIFMDVVEEDTNTVSAHCHGAPHQGQMLFCLGNVTNLLDVTPSNPMPHPLSPPPILLHVKVAR